MILGCLTRWESVFKIPTADRINTIRSVPATRSLIIVSTLRNLEAPAMLARLATNLSTIPMALNSANKTFQSALPGNIYLEMSAKTS